MLRLTPPTRGTFGLSVLAIAAGILIQLGLVTVAGLTEYEDPAFWITAAGGVMMTLGVLLKRM